MPIRRSPQTLSPLIVQPVAPAAKRSAASYALAGRLEEAMIVRERLQKLDPKLRISNLEDELGPYHRPQDIAKYVEGLRAAGLPD